MADIVGQLEEASSQVFKVEQLLFDILKSIDKETPSHDIVDDIRRKLYGARCDIHNFTDQVRKAREKR